MREPEFLINVLTSIEWEKIMFENELVRYQEKNGIARISLNRPEALNAMNRELLQELASVLDKVKVDDAIKSCHHYRNRGKGFFSWSGHQVLESGRTPRGAGIGPHGCFYQSQN